MSVVTLLDVKVLNNQAMFNEPYQFEITFEALENLQKDLEWKLTYVGSAQSAEHDQELDSLLVGPIPPGVNKFVFEADPPQLNKIPDVEIIGVTVILLTCSYDGREFVRVGYYVNNEYADPELIENPPAKPVIEKIKRNILAEKPRVTRFAIKWDSEESAPPEFPPDQPEADALPDDADNYGAEEEAEEVEAEEEGAEAGPAGAEAEGEDTEMGGVEGAAAAQKAEVDDEDETGSVDLEDESEDDEEDEEGEGEGEEGEGDEEMDGAEEASAVEQDAGTNGTTTHAQDVMVH